MDMRIEFSNLLSKYGSNVLLVRNHVKQQCTCWDITYGPKKTCPVCNGSGYLYAAFKVLAREQVVTGKGTLGHIITDSDLGDVLVPSKVFYLDYTTEPEIQDMIIECAWHNGAPSIDKYTSIYTINYVEPKRGDNGRIEYFRVSCEFDPVNASRMQAHVIKSYATKYLVSIA